MASTPTSQKPILIAGGGLASLLLGRSLLRSNLPFLIFERDASLVFRAQGYRLRLSTEGLAAIEAVLGPDAFRRFYDTCGKTGGAGFAAIDPLTGETLGIQHQSVAKEVLTSREGKIVGIARGEMRRLFMEGCEDCIRWSHHVTSYELTGDGVRAVFADGSKSVEGSMLVGGEGLRSEVAAQLSGGRIKVFDLGARGIHGQAPTTAFAGLGEGVFRLADRTSQPGGVLTLMTNVRPGEMHDPNVTFGWTMGGSPGVIKPPNDNYTIIGKPAADMAKALTAAWHPRVKPLIDNMLESEAAFWKITCSSPDGVPEWPNEPRVTVLGDAVHAMTPAGGMGANTAVRDAELLGRLLAEAGGYKEGVTDAYEKEMRVYASEAVRSSYGHAESSMGVKIDASTPTLA
ncbi:FAD/NAD(P)-binding domain-containing protein [Trematosphaeria pertusa]|uniref:FAD/NAD(P)-binding domain-containing protein n=1 Tax=Trematosphaeria pertusa TaxID=390896 RepID=A0A6A6HT24_9PLEO|nr:FAD/NAD(P)-binding domain-containing protein [Trematosphaeria pertusa]KAF2240673.1 FAD/NAD(P)-binding domain-containing protein [Trematosphaeria pertusa]